MKLKIPKTYLQNYFIQIYNNRMSDSVFTGF